MKEIDWIDLYETIMCKLYQRKYDNCLLYTSDAADD